MSRKHNQVAIAMKNEFKNYNFYKTNQDNPMNASMVKHLDSLLDNVESEEIKDIIECVYINGKKDDKKIEEYAKSMYISNVGLIYRIDSAIERAYRKLNKGC